MLLTSRLTEDKTMNSIKKSFQYINYHGQKYGEKAPYVVFNFLISINNKILGPEKYMLMDIMVSLVILL